jgi:hypothetical protein
MVNAMQRPVTANASYSVDMESVEAEFVRTELELAFSLLDVAAVTAKPQIARRCVRKAISAVRIAARFLAGARQGDGENADICQHQDELRQRVRVITRHWRIEAPG